jgi:thiamine biosynthesis lipoprotein
MKKWIALGFALIAALVLLLMPDREELKYYHNQGNVFGTYYNIKYEANEDLHHIIQSTLQSVDNSLSMFNPNSVISKINRNDSVILDSLFINMYKEAMEISTLSHGAFDITVAPMVHAWGFGKKIGQRTQTTDINIDSLKQLVGYNKISLQANQIIKQDPRITLDASAIAKGYGCDVVANALRAKGCKNLLVDIGGEVVLEGFNQEGEAWKVGISKPKKDASGIEDSLQKIIEGTNLCMATSGNYLQYYYVGNQRRSHTIDPRSGHPVEHSLLSATVIANSGMRADALATACMTLGATEAVEMIEKTDDAACYLIVAEQDTLRIITSTRWKY